MDMDIHIKGVQKLTLIDYPGKIGCVVFLNKCNFRCSFCHNPELVFNQRSCHFPDILPEEFFAYLQKRKNWIEGVCITGGEPTLHKGLIDFIKAIKNMDFSVKLDTNGSNPEIVRRVIDERLVDYIAMDIKNSPELYEMTCNAKINLNKIEESVNLIMKAGKEGIIDYEFRSTVLPRLHSKESMRDMAVWLAGAKRFFLQQFKSEESLVDDSFRDEKSFLLPELEEFKEILKKNIQTVEIRI